jgi:hypothetical protein
VIAAHAAAEAHLRRLESFAEEGSLRRARQGQYGVRRRYSDLDPDQRRGQRRLVRYAARSVLVGIGVFDAWYFSTMFLDLLRIPVTAPWWERRLGYLPGFVIPVGLVLAGILLSAPIWRMARTWRGQPAPDGADRRSVARRAGRVAAVVTFPAFVLYVVGLWAQIRATASAVAPGERIPPPQAWTVVVLLLGLALVAITIAVWLGNPVVADLRAADDDVRAARKKQEKREGEVHAALLALEQAWSDLLTDRDELLALVRTEIGKAWETLILPARMRHGATGYAPPDVLVPLGAAPSVTADASSPGNGGDLQRAVEFFASIRHPLPGLGPLNELVRLGAVKAPEPLRARRDEITARLDADLRGEPDPATGAPGW